MTGYRVRLNAPRCARCNEEVATNHHACGCIGFTVYAPGLNMETKERTWSNPLLDINNSFVKAGEKHEQITAASLTPFKRTALPMER